MLLRTPSCAVLMLLLLVGPSGDLARAQERTVRVVSRAELAAAMGAEWALSYDASATTNAARYFAGVVRRLARDAQAAHAYGPPLFVRYDIWFETIVSLSGLKPAAVPQNIRLAYEHRQNILIDYARDRVIKTVHDGERPELAVSVQLGWSVSPNLPSHYSYEDTKSKPRLQFTSHRLIKERILYFRDLIIYDQVQGITGRPTSGPLSVLFDVIGEGRVDWSRMVIAENGIQVVRGKASKGPVSIEETFFIRPDGTGEKGLPAQTSTWHAIEARLKRVPRIAYHGWRLPDFDPAW